MYSCLCHTFTHSHKIGQVEVLVLLYLLSGLPVHAHQSDTAAASVSGAGAGGPFGNVLSLPISSLFRDPYVPIRQLSSTSLWMEAVTEAAAHKVLTTPLSSNKCPEAA